MDMKGLGSHTRRGRKGVQNKVSAPALTIAEIQPRLDALVVAMSAKALREPDATFRVQANCAPRVSLNWRGTGARYDLKFSGFDTLDEAGAWVAALPTPEQARLQEFLASLDATIQLGKKADVDVEAINPMLEILKRISKNAITHQASS